MTKKLELYRCKVCGNLVQVILDGVGELVCCGENMEKLDPNKSEHVPTEYHIPVYKHLEDGLTYIQVGKEKHPMTEEHHIEFIERISADESCVNLKYLKPDEEPVFHIKNRCENEKAIEYCNLHGLWEGKNND